MSRDIYLDRDDIEAIVMALRARVPHYQDMEQKSTSVSTSPTAAGYARQQRRRVESIAARLAGLGQAIVTERPHR